jgi:hypothetical protein
MIAVFAAETPSGVVSGAMGYVWASYAVTWLFFVGYVATLVVRSREESS